MRELYDHRVNGLNEAINIIVMDAPGAGNACHHYRIEPIVSSHPQGAINPCEIKFQQGPIQEVGVNGLSNEALMTVVIDRLRGFQSGPFACRENAIALTSLEESLMWLQKRTRDRMARGVEGTNQK